MKKFLCILLILIPFNLFSKSLSKEELSAVSDLVGFEVLYGYISNYDSYVLVGVLDKGITDSVNKDTVYVLAYSEVRTEIRDTYYIPSVNKDSIYSLAFDITKMLEDSNFSIKTFIKEKGLILKNESFSTDDDVFTKTSFYVLPE